MTCLIDVWWTHQIHNALNAVLERTEGRLINMGPRFCSGLIQLLLGVGERHVDSIVGHDQLVSPPDLCKSVDHSRFASEVPDKLLVRHPVTKEETASVQVRMRRIRGRLTSRTAAHCPHAMLSGHPI
jgi:hypothetical protein